MRKPLYSMSAAQLGPDIEDLEQTLTTIHEICTKWSAILLLDEADVFLEKRELKDLRRNKLVSGKNNNPSPTNPSLTHFVRSRQYFFASSNTPNPAPSSRQTVSRPLTPR